LRPLRHFLLAVLIGLAPLMAHAAERQPNIVIIVADDLGYGELGCQGNPEIPTPNIDSLARNGVRLSNGYVTAPVCTPSRAGFMTGRYQNRFGHELNATGAQNLAENVGLPLTETTLATRLKAAGYATGLSGKWHLGATPPFHPQKRGFDESFGFLQEGHFYLPITHPGVTSFLRTNQVASGNTQRQGNVIWSTHLRSNEPPYDENNPLARGTQPMDEKEYLTDAFTREAVAYIGRHQKEPFFLYLPYNAPHSPMQGTEKYLKRFEDIPNLHRRVFAAMLAALDDGVGQVLAKLRQLNLEEDTLIFFFSDNGGPTTELTSSNLPLSGGKGSLSEGGIRIPFLVQWRKRLPAGKVYDHPVISLDIFATALAAAGVQSPGGAKLDGIDLVPFLTGQRAGPPHESLYWRYGAQSAIRSGNWKLQRTGAQQAWQLYDLSQDIAEKSDLASQKPEIVKNLEAKWHAWNAELVDPIWGPPNRAGKGKKNKE
jgi:arylsulfatase A-like enzyme